MKALVKKKGISLSESVVRQVSGTFLSRARICKRLRSLGIDSNQESIPPAYVAWRACTSNMVVAPTRQAGNRILGSLKGLQIRAQDWPKVHST
jgi:hypothetical protein